MADKYFLSIHSGHNASAALMMNGDVIASLQEERVTRIKNQMGYPKNAIDFCLNYAGILGKDIEKVGITTKNPRGLIFKAQFITQFTIRDYLNYYGEDYYVRQLRGEDCFDYLKWLRDDPKFNQNEKHYDFSYLTDDILKDGKEDIRLFQKEQKRTISNHLNIDNEKIELLDHHTCHAYYAYYASPSRGKDTIVLTMDSYGDGRNQTVWIARGDRLELLADSNQNDIARIYKMTTLLLGMRPNEHEYKVMGLAPYANKKYKDRVLDKLKDLLDVKNMAIVRKERPSDLFSYFKDAFADERFDNIAMGLQLFTEEIIEKLIQDIYEKTDVKRFVISGGVSMNVKVNKAIAELPCVDYLYVPGSGGDESLSIGGLFLLNGKGSKPLHHLYLGPDIADEYQEIAWDEISPEYFVKHGVGITDVARLLADGEIIAVINGKTEFGARALGNRSILANPKNREVIREINEAIKSRDFWMPFALSILEDKVSEYITNPKNISSHFMTVAFDTIDRKYHEIQAGSHPYDKTVRPQFVSKIYASDYYKLIETFFKITGIPALLNTSFNLHGEPIVNDFKDALRTFQLSGLDHLFVNYQTLISKKDWQ